MECSVIAETESWSKVAKKSRHQAGVSARKFRK
jgi:hypothetical protein